MQAAPLLGTSWPSSHLGVGQYVGVRAVKQEEVVVGGGWALLGLQLRAHLEGNTGSEGVPGYAVGPLRLHLLDAVNVVGGQVRNAIQGGRCNDKQRAQHLVENQGPRQRVLLLHMHSTLGALQTVGGHAELGGQAVEHSGGTFNGVHEEQRPLGALH